MGSSVGDTTRWCSRSRRNETDLGLNGVQREISKSSKPAHIGDRMDLLIPGNQLLLPMVAAGQRVRVDKGFMIDFTHCSNTGLSHRAYSAEQKSGAQAERSAAGKHTKYQGHYYPDSYQLIPIAVESFGAMATQTHEAFTSFSDM